MTPQSKPIIFFGTEDFSLYSLTALVEAGFPVVAVVTKPDSKRGRGNTMTQPAVKTYALSKGIPVWQPTKLVDITDDIKTFDAPVGVLVSYGKIIPTSIIDLFTPGIINVHPSLLPLYRGPSPIEAAIENRDAKTGVTLMQLAPKMDAGPIYYQAMYVLDQTETKPELYQTLGTLGANLLVQKLPLILDGNLTAAEQNEAEATYCHLLTKETSLLDPTTMTPGEAEARIRAHLGFPRTRFQVGPYTVIVTKAHAVMTKNTPLDIECQNGAYLSIDELVAPSGRVMSGEAFLRGYPL
jgi:methionyl-tRNA formyltransferase